MVRRSDWCGVPISLVNDMKIYNDGRIIWLTRHCRKDYAVAFNVTRPEEVADLPEMLKEAFGFSEANHGKYRPFEGSLG